MTYDNVELSFSTLVILKYQIYVSIYLMTFKEGSIEEASSMPATVCVFCIQYLFVTYVRRWVWSRSII